MERDHILSEIQRVARENGGKAPGRERFAAATGIQQAHWYGRYWARWGDALQEAGLAPNRLTTATPESAILRELAKFVRELGRWPVDAELQLRARSNPEFPDRTTVVARLGNKSSRVTKLRAFALEHDMLDVVALCPPIEPSQAAGSRVETSPTDGFVYLLKLGKHFKIGKTFSVPRRHREIALELPEKPEHVHSIRTDDPDGIERYWHTRFEAKRTNGEWFTLTRDDVTAFKKRRFM
jgi:Meiotically up-regulated gene 113/Homing endonuclease associated repeat